MRGRWPCLNGWFRSSPALDRPGSRGTAPTPTGGWCPSDPSASQSAPIIAQFYGLASAGPWVQQFTSYAGVEGTWAIYVSPDDGPGVLLGAYTFGANSFQYAALSPEERVRKTVEYGSQIHPQYKSEFQHGVAVAWHRVPWTLGCAGHWTEELRARHYGNLCAIDGRIMLAGEHASRLPAWQEGALLSSLDAIKRLHERVLAG